MSRFYFLIWLKWTFRLTLCSVVLALVFSLLITSITYIIQGMVALNSDVVKALFDLVQFWFPVVWSLTLLIALFRSLKYIFNSCSGGYEFKLLTCKENEIIETVGYGDLVKVWRRWFMLLIWLVGSIMIIALVFTNLFTSYSGIFEWFDIYYLFGFILLSGYFSFVLLGSRCRRIKVVRC